MSLYSDTDCHCTENAGLREGLEVILPCVWLKIGMLYMVAIVIVMKAVPRGNEIARNQQLRVLFGEHLWVMQGGKRCYEPGLASPPCYFPL